ncbi:MAG TPA: hypothetical protein VFU36_11410 [Jatrophihabitans sp.]|nr:hypothetical protein [Jatrophihabitans sp.]
MSTIACCMIVPFTLAAVMTIALRRAALEPAVDVPEPELAYG